MVVMVGRSFFLDLKRLGAPVMEDGYDNFLVCNSVCRTSGLQLNKHGKFEKPDLHYCYLVEKRLLLSSSSSSSPSLQGGS